MIGGLPLRDTELLTWCGEVSGRCWLIFEGYRGGGIVRCFGG